MNIPDRILNLLTYSQLLADEESIKKIFLFKLFAYSSLFVLGFSGIRYLATQHFLNVMVMLSSFFLIFASILAFPPSKKYSTVSVALSLILGLSLIYVFYSRNTIPNGSLFLFFYPVITISILGIKKGFLFSLTLPAILIPGILFPEVFPGINKDLNFFISILTGYFFLIVIMYFRDYFHAKSQHEYRNRVNRSVNETREKNEFISRISHQLRTSLSNIVLANNLVESSNPDPEHKELIDTLQASTNNLAATINKLVDVPRPDDVHLKETRISFKLASVIDNIAHLFRKETQLELEFDVNDKVPEFLIGDPVKLKQILLNLIQGTLLNEDKYRQLLNICVHPVKDTEEGITLEVKLKSCIYGKNHQALKGKECRNQPDNQQFDLELTTRMVESTGGQLMLKEEEEADYIIMNLTYGKDLSRKPEIKITENIVAAGKKPVKLSDASILIVEDNHINQKIVILSIQDLVKSIDVAANGKEALDMFGKSKYDIILMDVQMPVMNGILATKKIREIESATNTKTPIIAITANALAGDRENCLAVGMDEYISKPFSIDELIEKMKDLLQESKQG